MGDHLRVDLGAEPVPAPQEVATQLAVVVDLSVEDHHHVARLVVDGLRSVLDVDDGEPLRPERHAILHMHAARVRSAMLHRRAHPVHERGVDRLQ